MPKMDVCSVGGVFEVEEGVRLKCRRGCVSNGGCVFEFAFRMERVCVSKGGVCFECGAGILTV